MRSNVRVGFVLAVAVVMSVFIGAEAPSPAQADHYCDGGWVIGVETPDTGFYIHERAQIPGTALLNPPGDETEGTWIFMESGETPHLQTGGRLLIDPIDCWECGDPCPRRPDSDWVVF